MDTVMQSAAAPLWRAGFRPFFLSAAVYALLALLLWILNLTGLLEVNSPIPVSLIHGHEMIFGLGTAAVAGFILTAMPNWTGTTPLSGLPLAGLYSLWLAGRVALWSGPLLTLEVVAILDLLFLPVLAGLTALTLYKSGNFRNLVLPCVFLLLAGCNLLFYLAELGFVSLSPRAPLEAAISILLVLITIIGGRIIPAFTRNALQKKGEMIVIATPPPLTLLCIIGTVLMVPGDLWFSEISPEAFAIYCLLLSLLHFARLAFWKGWRTLGDPLLWSMHLGYLWLPAGLLLKAFGLQQYGYFWEGALHALTAGSIATMILIVMIRAGLGHSGRALTSTRVLTLALVFLSLSALFRVLQSFFDGNWTTHLLHCSALLWILAFGLYVFYFFPIMFQPRADGKTG
ncbi:NnrS family protein [Kiloniella laminariae]|uniref:NnrS family protein n=1 Tax=Kiloniella laminariae TaxID=454162 RepID=A0ABT4LK03_9PROT|nr:NnrS family protein [Kiloniella laminariae]MCZ4281440.1 NnrS family protein [Kiloniella laminariae]